MKRNIVSILRDRELNNKKAPCFSTSKIVRRLINSDKELYTTKWSKRSSNEIFYENGMLFFNNYKDYILVNGIKKNSVQSPGIRSVENIDVISNDIIFYSGFKNIENTCQCEIKCICLSQCLFSTTESNYLDQHLMANGRIVRRVYLGIGHDVEFRYCAWDTPNERFSLIGFRTLDDDLTYLIVFTVPLELYVLLEIKKLVFPEVESVKLSQNLLIVENSTHFNIYHFDEFIRQGTLTPCKLGDVYQRGKIGSYPAGIPVNFLYDEASPILFRVEFFIDILSLNSNPTHYISLDRIAFGEAEARIVEIKTNFPIGDPVPMNFILEYDVRYMGKIDEIIFHPDKSGRLILKTDESVTCYNLLSRNANRRICSHTFELLPSNSEISLENPSLRVLSFEYNSELNIFGILIQISKYPRSLSHINTGVVNIYDNNNYELLRTVKLKNAKISDVRNYTLFFNPYSIIVRESAEGEGHQKRHTVYVYMM